MKKVDFVKGKVGYMIETDSRISPDRFYIDEVEIENYEGEGWGNVWDFANERSEQVKIKNVFYSYKDAKKALLRFLSKAYQEHYKTVE